MLLTRTIEWFRRMSWPEMGQAALGWGSEYWDLDPSGYEGSDELGAKVQSLGRHWNRQDLALELSMNLLSDVLVAAGGVEHSILALREAVAETQRYADKHVKPTSGVRHGIQTGSVTEAWYEFANCLTWARAFDERLDRPPSPNARHLRRQGLLPAIRPRRLHARVDRLVNDLRAGPLGETRFLANYTLHAGLVRHSFSGANIGANGRVLLPLPDRITGRVYHWQVLNWKEGRDAMTFVQDLWASIETFMDGLLDAFERAIPKRFRRSP